VEKKKWYQSKTMWVNLGAAVTDAALSVVTDYGTGGVVTVISAANMLLRTFTKTPVTK
jgi:type II secretory pathway component PulL